MGGEALPAGDALLPPGPASTPLGVMACVGKPVCLTRSSLGTSAWLRLCAGQRAVAVGATPDVGASQPQEARVGAVSSWEFWNAFPPRPLPLLLAAHTGLQERSKSSGNQSKARAHWIISPLKVNWSTAALEPKAAVWPVCWLSEHPAFLPG